MCEVLKFRLHHATPVKFVHEYLLASQDGMQTLAYEVFHPMLRSMVYYLLELSRMSYELVPTRPSLVAAAAVFLGRATLGIRCQESETADSNGFWTKTLEFYTQYTVEQLKSTVQVLLHYHRGAEEASLHAVFSKYNKAKFTYVATKTALSLPELGLDN